MKPFATTEPPSREALLAYARGRLSPAEQREVEEHLERDPLLREALEGLQEPGALEAFTALDAQRPTASNGLAAAWWIGGCAAVAFAVLALLWFGAPQTKGTKPMATAEQPLPTPGPLAPVTAAVPPEEIAAAREQPASDRIGHERLALHTREAARLVQREEGTTRVDPRPSGLSQELDSARLRTQRGQRSGVDLLFLHDLKLVHPKELYGKEPELDLDEAHVAARFAAAAQRDSIRSHDVLVVYTDFLDEALGRFVANDHKGCLDDLRFLLAQYPDDVNGLFYAGLCAYNVGLYDRARTLLHRAATHPVDVFNEEAAWYHALTLERMDDPGTAEAFKRIAAGDGFYSELAKKRSVNTR